MCQNRSISGNLLNSGKNDSKGVFGPGSEMSEWVCVCVHMWERQKETSHFRIAPWLAGNLNVATEKVCSPKQKDVERWFADFLALPNLDFSQWVF